MFPQLKCVYLASNVVMYDKALDIRFRMMTVYVPERHVYSFRCYSNVRRLSDVAFEKKVKEIYSE
jgi:hypothetical protein